MANKRMDTLRPSTRYQNRVSVDRFQARRPKVPARKTNSLQDNRKYYLRVRGPSSIPRP